jgi:hypothetical protein
MSTQAQKSKSQWKRFLIFGATAFCLLIGVGWGVLKSVKSGRAKAIRIGMRGDEVAAIMGPDCLSMYALAPPPHGCTLTQSFPERRLLDDCLDWWTPGRKPKRDYREYRLHVHYGLDNRVDGIRWPAE